MIGNFIRNNRIVAAIMVVVRLVLGWKWVTSGWGKVTGGFDASGYLNGAVAKAAGENPVVSGWWGSFVETFALPNVKLFNFLVPWGELLVGIGLILGCFTIFAAMMGMTMNFSFLLSGTISTNPEMAIFAILIVVAGANAGRYGLDRYVMPKLRSLFFRKNKEEQVGGQGERNVLEPEHI